MPTKQRRVKELKLSKETLGDFKKVSIMGERRGRFFGRATPAGVILTTGQAAILCGVAPRTVSKWCDSGRVRSYKIPGCLDRRMFAHDLVNILKEGEAFVHPDLEVLAGMRAATVLTIGVPARVRADFDRTVAEAGQGLIRTLHTETPFDAGMVFGFSRVTGVVVGPEAAAADGRMVVRSVVKYSKESIFPVRLIAVVGSDALGSVDTDLFDEVWDQGSADWSQVARDAARTGPEVSTGPRPPARGLTEQLTAAVPQSETKEADRE